MRILALAAVLAGCTLTAIPVQAQTYDPAYPVCMHVVPWGGGAFEDCSFYTMEQCQMSASGRAAQCNPNPYYGRPVATTKRTLPGRRVY